LDEIHRSHGTLVDYFEAKFGRKNTKNYQKAQKNFMNSLAAYSLVCYVLQIKDRHNQNIMLDEQGHILHIDFGFLLSNSPGKGLKFEKAPFKLT
jgi:phosphatidylinositol kinase/protein kinase (PI-3  family)